MARKDFKKGCERFVKLPNSLLSELHRLKVSVGARALHVELIARFTGANNGRLYLPHREAADLLDVTRNTVAKYFTELERAGFIVQTKAAQLGVEGKGRAAQWRLTHLPHNARPPTADYRNLEPPPKNRATPAQKLSQGDGENQDDG
jgi:DNA-binding transcriptional MocR family regulator